MPHSLIHCLPFLSVCLANIQAILAMITTPVPWLLRLACLCAIAAWHGAVIAVAAEGSGLAQCCKAADDLPAGTCRVAPPERMAFIVGAAKAGTTFLFEELVGRHPFILGRKVKGNAQHQVCTWGGLAE